MKMQPASGIKSIRDCYHQFQLSYLIILDIDSLLYVQERFNITKKKKRQGI